VCSSGCGEMAARFLLDFCEDREDDDDDEEPGDMMDEDVDCLCQ